MIIPVQESSTGAGSTIAGGGGIVGFGGATGLTCETCWGDSVRAAGGAPEELEVRAGLAVIGSLVSAATGAGMKLDSSS